MSDLLSIGSAGVKAYRNALSTVSDNISNADTDGYARRDIKIVEQSGGGSGSVLYRGTASAGGVYANSVVRAWDDFKAADARAASSDAARSDARVTWLTAAENAVPSDDTGTGAKLGSFFGALTSLAADPNGSLPRKTVLTTLETATSAIKSDADALARVAGGIGDATRSTVGVLNGNLAALAEVNGALSRANPGSAGQANLMDQRDKLLGDISSAMSVSVQLDPRGAATVSVAGTGGATLVSGTSTSQVGATVATDGTIALSVTGATTTAISPAGGSLAGFVNSAAAVAAERTELNGIANDFVTAVNAWNAGGKTPAGTAGTALLTIGAGGAATIALATSDPSKIAAASADGTANGNVLDLSALRSPTGAEARMSALVLGAASTLNQAKSEQAATGARKDATAGALSETSGVDLDREAADLIRYQQAYDASARVIQVARETLQSILSIF